MDNILKQLEQVLEERKSAKADESYVASLYAKGLDEILKKIGEESAEVIMAAKDGEQDKIIYEVADLWFHTLVLLRHKDIEIDKIQDELSSRFEAWAFSLKVIIEIFCK